MCKTHFTGLRVKHQQKIIGATYVDDGEKLAPKVVEVTEKDSVGFGFMYGSM